MLPIAIVMSTARTRSGKKGRLPRPARHRASHRQICRHEGSLAAAPGGTFSGNRGGL
jgi:hypothetical protein